MTLKNEERIKKESRKTKKKKENPRLRRSRFLGFEEKAVMPANAGGSKLQKEAWLIRLGA